MPHDTSRRERLRVDKVVSQFFITDQHKGFVIQMRQSAAMHDGS